MNNNTEFIGGSVGTAITALGASLSVTELQAIISIVATIIGLLITLTTAVIIPTWKKIREAKKDGKITPEEVEDIVDTIDEGIDEVKDSIDNTNRSH